MTTKTELITWLQSLTAIRVVLVEVTDVGQVGGGNASYFLSSVPYSSATTIYDPIIIGGVSFNELLSLDGSVLIGFGDIEIENTNGIRDLWLNNYWEKRRVTIHLGDITWLRSQFYQVFDGLISTIVSRSLNVLNLVLVDKLQKLNETLQSRKIQDLYAGTIVSGLPAYLNKDKLIPLIFGEVFNIEPVPCSNDVNTLLYKVNDGAIHDIIEVRDNGVPVVITKNLLDGLFTLSQSSYGQITCLIQGLLTNNATLPLTTALQLLLEHVKTILTSYGPLSSRVDWNTEVDTTLITALLLSIFLGSIQYGHVSLGIFLLGGENKLEVVQKLLASISIHLTTTSSGKFKYVLYKLPATHTYDTNTVLIQDSDFEYASLLIQEKTTPIYSIRLGYAKNYTQQEGNLAGAVPDAHKQLYKDEYIVVQKLVATNLYNLEQDTPDIQETTLIDTPYADGEATIRINNWGIPRYLYMLTGYAHLLPTELGDIVHLKTNRFGLDTGKNGLVVLVDRNWINGRVTLGILV